jgi:hypothetical protein
MSRACPESGFDCEPDERGWSTPTSSGSFISDPEDDLASGDAEIVPLQIGALDSRLLRQRDVQRQTASDDQRRDCRDSYRLHVGTLPLIVSTVLNTAPSRTHAALEDRPEDRPNWN